MLVQPYLNFDGRCEEAIDFYKGAVNADVKMLMRFKESPDQSMMSPGSGEKILHAELRIGDSTVFVSDGHVRGEPSFKGIALSLTATNDAEAEKLFAALATGGQIQLPMGKTFFSSRFGMLADRFGVGWMILTAPQ